MLPLPKTGQSDWQASHETELARRWLSEPFSLSELNSSVNFVKRLQSEQTQLVLRISHASRRPLDWLLAESAWLVHLQTQGLDLSRPLPSLQGHWVESAGPFYAVAFAWAEGQPSTFFDDNAWGLQEIFELGRLIGKLHLCAENWEPPAERRPDWETLHALPDCDWAPEEAELLAEYHQTLLLSQSWPRNKADYGLIHGDVSPLNLLVRPDASFTLLDFDDACYAFYAQDLAGVLFHYLLVKSAHNRRLFLQKFLPCLLAGYRQERPLDPIWESRMIPLLKLHSLWFMLSTAHVLMAQGGPLTPEARLTLRTRFGMYQGLG